MTPTDAAETINELVGRLRENATLLERQAPLVADDAQRYASACELGAAALRRSLAMEQAIRAFLAKWEAVEPQINSRFALQQIRTGVSYQGPTIAAELTALRESLPDPPCPTPPQEEQ